MMEISEINTRNDLAKFLNIPKNKLSYILYIKGINNLYTSFEIQKKNGGIRRIYKPQKDLKEIQRSLVEKLLVHKNKKRQKQNNISHGFEKDKNILTNAKIHRNKRIVFNLDLEDFFESIHFGRVRGYFHKNKDFLLPLEVATIIAQITCYEGKLPQGAPTSPLISNLICEILDNRLLKVARKYRLDYTRYADDLTFSTNDRKFIVDQKEFYDEVSRELLRAGFKINEKKTRLQLRDSKQTVTGLIVNKKINVDRVYYKETRAMAYSLYTKGFFEINGEKANINQLEGRFSFINQINRYNNTLDGKKHNYNNLGSRELQYQKFLFYKYFFANPKPLIITEGKTDIAYLKSALKNLYAEYPNLITKNSDGTFDFKVAFLNKTKRLKYFLGIFQDGGSALNNVANFFISKKKKHNYLNEFKEISNTPPQNPVILLFDNELNGPKAKDKPLAQFINYAKLGDHKKDILSKDNMVNIIDNLYLLTVPLIGEKLESDIEDLFDSTTLSHKIEGRTFTKQDDYNVSKFYGKEIFSKYIINNYLNINFNGFKPVLNNIENMMKIYNASPSQLKQHSLQEKIPLEV